MIKGFLALVLTIVIEFIVVWFFIKKNPFKLLCFITLINCLTHPLALYFYLNSLANLWMIEILVFLTEVILLKLLLEIRYPKAVLISFIANLVTTLVGILISI